MGYETTLGYMRPCLRKPKINENSSAGSVQKYEVGQTVRALRELASEVKKEVKTCTNSFPRNDENQVQVVHPLLAPAVPRVG